MTTNISALLCVLSIYGVTSKTSEKVLRQKSREMSYLRRDTDNIHETVYLRCTGFRWTEWMSQMSTTPTFIFEEYAQFQIGVRMEFIFLEAKRPFGKTPGLEAQ